MKLIFKFILHVLANALAIFLLAHFLPQYVVFTGDILDYLFVGVILALANLIVRPVLKIISAPLIFITMGLFILVINGAILYAVDWFVESLAINGLIGYLWGTLAISIINAIALKAYKKAKAD
jgi:putative membrane protein